MRIFPCAFYQLNTGCGKLNNPMVQLFVSTPFSPQILVDLPTMLLDSVIFSDDAVCAD